MSKLPFLFMVDMGEGKQHFIVKVASCFDYKCYDATWMDCQDLPTTPKGLDGGGPVYIPDVDLCDSSHKFDTEAEALEFMRDWWLGAHHRSAFPKEG